MEELIFWLFLGFVVFSRVFAWIIDRLRGQQVRPPAPAPASASAQSEPEDDFFEDDWEDMEQPARTTPAPATKPDWVPALASGLAQPATSRPAIVTAADQGRRLRQQLGLDQRSTLQRSVLLMTVLGPCRANEQRSAPQ